MSDNSALKNTGNVLPISIEKEIKSSYLDYSMSVITGRALPDARDGFKPVHRRVLYAMHIDGLTPDKSYVKSAEIVGKVMGLFHPHGDSAIYETLVRMAQDFSLRYPLIQGQGNFGGRGDESAAAMRYTEARMSKMAPELLRDIDKETVDFIPNYSNKTVEPTVLPTRIPNLLINGTSGIAVGLATNIPPHNLTEVLNGCLAYVDNPDISIDELMTHIPAPDFPTGCQILGKSGIRDAYHTGRGKLYLRSVYSVTEKNGVKRINITEIPYQVSYNKIIEQITKLVKDNAIQGIVDILNLSKNNINIELRIHKDFDPHVIMNQLFAKTSLQSSVSFNMIALHKGIPKTLTLKDAIEIFINFRRETITRRCVYELKKARQRTHILEAYLVALANINEIIELIRSKSVRKEAHDSLMAKGWSYDSLQGVLERLGADPAQARPDFLPAQFGINPSDNLYYLSNEQAKAILDMPLSRLVGLEVAAISNEYTDLVAEIIRLLSILNDADKLTVVLKDELIEVRDRHQTKDNDYDARKSPISNEATSIKDEELINEEDVVITYTKDSYIKTQALNEYRSQSRGGRGKQSGNMKEDDQIDQLVVGTTKDIILCMTNTGRVFQIKVYQLPKVSRNGRGRPINNFIDFKEDETITNIILLKKDELNDLDSKALLFVTEKGKVKKTELSAFKNIRSMGLKAIKLESIEHENGEVEVIDRVANVTIVKPSDTIYLISKYGMLAAFSSDKVRSQGRTSSGVRGMKLANADDKIISVIVPGEDNAPIMTVTNLGLGKRTELEQIPVRTNRGSKGVKIHKLTAKAGLTLVSATQVNDKDQLVIITDGGKLVRINAESIRIAGRNSSGVKLINLSDGEQVATVERILNGVEIEQEDLLALKANEAVENGELELPLVEGDTVVSAEVITEVEAEETDNSEPKTDAE